MALEMKKKTEREIKPTVYHEITIFEQDMLEILGMKHVMCDYISEGSATLKEFWGEDGIRMQPAEAKQKLKDWLFHNGYLCDLEQTFSKFETSHHFGSEDYDGCRPSVYYCKFKLWYDPSKTDI